MTFSVRQILILLAGALASYNFGLAGGYIENNPGSVSIGGLVAGVVVNLTIAVLASALGSVKGKNRRKQANIGMVLLMGISPVMIAPSIFYLLGDDFLIPIFRGLYALFWASLPDIAIYAAGASNGAQGVLKLDAAITIPMRKQASEQELPGKQASKGKGKSKSKPATPKPQAVKSKRARKSKPASGGKVDVNILLDKWRKEPGLSDAEIGAVFGVSRQAIQGRRKKMIDEGIIKMTMDGVKVL